jgi:hypothetical protein
VFEGTLCHCGDRSNLIVHLADVAAVDHVEKADETKTVDRRVSNTVVEVDMREVWHRR